MKSRRCPRYRVDTISYSIFVVARARAPPRWSWYHREKTSSHFVLAHYSSPAITRLASSLHKNMIEPSSIHFFQTSVYTQSACTSYPLTNVSSTRSSAIFILSRYDLLVSQLSSVPVSYFFSHKNIVNLTRSQIVTLKWQKRSRAFAYQNAGGNAGIGTASASIGSVRQGHENKLLTK